MKSKNVELLGEQDAKLIRKILLGIFFFTFLLYGNSIKNNYALDDNYVTVTNPKKHDNPRIEKGIKGIPKLFKSRFVETAQQSFDYRPLPLATFAIEYQFFGSNPHISHFINVLLYALTCMLLFVILHKLFKEYHVVFPLLVTLFFIVHPIHTEVVDNIKCRDELMVFLFGLIATYFFIKNLEGEGYNIKYIIYTILFLMLALLCKKTAVLFLVFIPLTGWYYYPVNLKKYIPIVFLVGLIAVFGISLFKHFAFLEAAKKLVVREHAFFENPLYYDKSFSFKLLISIYTCGYYLKLFLIPYPLSCYYGYNTVPATWGSVLIWLTIIIYVLLAFYAFRNIFKKDKLSYGILIYLLGVLPFSNFIKPAPGIIAERFMYMGSLGFCLVIVYLLFNFFKVNLKGKSNIYITNTAKISLTILLLFFSVLTFSRNQNWKDILTLFRTDTITKAESCNLHYLLGNEDSNILNLNSKPYETSMFKKEMQMHYTKTIDLMKEGVKKYPMDYITLNNIGRLYVDVFNKPDSALPLFYKSLSINPTDFVTQFNYAYCFEKIGMLDSAIYFYEKSISSQTDYMPAYIQLRNIYIGRMQYDKLILCDEKAVLKKPIAELYVNLGNSYFLNKDTINAVIQFKRAIEVESGNTGLKNQVEDFLKSIKRN